MHVSRYYIQQLEKAVRQSRRRTAAEEAKKAGSNKIRKTPGVNLRHNRKAKTYEMPR